MNHRSSYIPLSDAKNIIIDALHQFSPELAERASNILHDEDRLNIVGVVNPITQMMQYRPARDIVKDNIEHGELTNGTATKKGVIDLEYDGRPSSIVWLAHELGHAIADDIQIDNGHSEDGLFSEEENESQAYFVQQIVSAHIQENLVHPDISDNDLNRDTSTMSAWRRAAYIDASQNLEHARQTSGAARHRVTILALDQRLG